MTPPRSMPLTVPVNGEFLTLGQVHAQRGDRVVEPPDESLFVQLRRQLERGASRRSSSGALSPHEEAVAAASLCVRWGSYYALLADRCRSMWRAPVGASRIANNEMARINIEASAALAEMLTLRMRAPKAYATLVRASASLPLELVSPPRDQGDVPLGAIVGRIDEALATGLLPSRPDLEQALSQHPIRALANSIINCCWRNGPIEDIHAGDEAPTPLPLTKRRISTSSDRRLMTSLVVQLTEAFTALGPIIAEQGGHARAARILAFIPTVWPSFWTLSEDARAVKLVGVERP